MVAATPALLLALVLGSLRALMLWRASSRVDVVNVVVITTLAQGREADLAELLASSGRGAYLAVARRIGEAAVAADDDEQELRRSLEREARLALASMHQHLSRFAWLDSVGVVAIAYTGLTALIGEQPTLLTTLGLVAASLLWLSNVRAARSLATQAYAGAMALVDGVLAARRELRENSKPVEPK